MCILIYISCPQINGDLAFVKFHLSRTFSAAIFIPGPYYGNTKGGHIPKILIFFYKFHEVTFQCQAICKSNFILLIIGKNFLNLYMRAHKLYVTKYANIFHSNKIY